jgi:hypothetical protein
MSVELPTGFESIILSEAKSPATNLPQGFKGAVLSFSGETVFITVKNGLGKPIAGMEVSTDYSSTTLTGYTDENGSVQILSDDIGTIRFQKEKTFRLKSFDRVTEGSIVNYVFNVPMLE